MGDLPHTQTISENASAYDLSPCPFFCTVTISDFYQG